MSTILSIAAIGGSGPKSTAVQFLKVDGIRQWGWVPNEIAAELVAGMRLEVPVVSLGAVETTWTKDGVEQDLKVPRQQLFLGGDMVALPPDSEPLQPMTLQVTEQAKAYREAYLAKQAKATAPAPVASEVEPI